jgi:hypothetical protein
MVPWSHLSIAGARADAVAGRLAVEDEFIPERHDPSLGALTERDGATDLATSPVVTSSQDGSGDVVVDDDPVANAPALVPSATFAIENPDQLSSVAMSPDGTQIAVVTHAELGDPVTIRLHDSTTGEADRNTGVVDASDGLIGMGDDLCRVDAADGSVMRSGAGVLIDPEKFWLVPGSGGVVVADYPNGDGPRELVTLDGASHTPQSAVEVVPGDSVRAVGVTTWLSRSTVPIASNREEFPYRHACRPTPVTREQCSSRRMGWMTSCSSPPSTAS